MAIDSYARLGYRVNTHGHTWCVETACSDILALVRDNIDSHGEFDTVSGATPGTRYYGLVHRNNLMTRIRSMPVRDGNIAFIAVLSCGFHERSPS